MSERSDNIGKTCLSDRSIDIAKAGKLVNEIMFTNTGDETNFYPFPYHRPIAQNCKAKKDGKRLVFLKSRCKAEKDGKRRKKSAILTIVLRSPY